MSEETITIPFCAECKKIPVHAISYRDEELDYCPLCYHCCFKEEDNKYTGYTYQAYCIKCKHETNWGTEKINEEKEDE